MSESSHYVAEPAGFGTRVGASLFDTFLVALITDTVLLWAFGRMYFIDPMLAEQGTFDDVMLYLFPLVAVIGFWLWCAATPGKLVLDMKIVDASTGGKPTLKQWVIRYLGYFVSALPLGLGFLWVIFDKRNQAWHDKMANTLVVHDDEFEALNQELDKAFS
jgi:uncharacterized RDD family membrane protein YckC